MSTTQMNVLRFGSAKLVSLLTAILLAACITVNVNFPESAVQRAADNFVQDLYKDTTASTIGDAAQKPTDAPAEKETAKETKKKNKKPTTDSKTSAPTTDSTKHTSLFHFELITSVSAEEAHAQELNMSSKKAQEIKAKMAARVPTIVDQKRKSLIGETFDGNLVVKDDSKLSKDEKKSLKELVEQENKDRNDLYEEIQSTNSISDRKQTRIRRFFGSAFKSNSPSGTWIETEEGKWNKK